MADRLTKEQRHKNMSAIRGKNTGSSDISRDAAIMQCI